MADDKDDRDDFTAGILLALMTEMHDMMEHAHNIQIQIAALAVQYGVQLPDAAA